jgi:hypothetical protein
VNELGVGTLDARPIRHMDRPAIGRMTPEDPPPGCVDPRIWQLAQQMLISHTPSHSGWCSRCGGSYPCAGRRLADAGVDTAMGRANPEAVYWSAYTRLLAADDRLAPSVPPGRDVRAAVA